MAWRIDTAGQECHFADTARASGRGNQSFLDFHVFPDIDRIPKVSYFSGGPMAESRSATQRPTAFCKVVELVRPTGVDCVDIDTRVGDHKNRGAAHEGVRSDPARLQRVVHVSFVFYSRC